MKASELVKKEMTIDDFYRLIQKKNDEFIYIMYSSITSDTIMEQLKKDGFTILDEGNGLYAIEW